MAVKPSACSEMSCIHLRPKLEVLPSFLGSLGWLWLRFAHFKAVRPILSGRSETVFHGGRRDGCSHLSEGEVASKATHLLSNTNSSCSHFHYCACLRPCPASPSSAFLSSTSPPGVITRPVPRRTTGATPAKSRVTPASPTTKPTDNSA